MTDFSPQPVSLLAAIQDSNYWKFSEVHNHNTVPLRLFQTSNIPRLSGDDLLSLVALPGYATKVLVWTVFLISSRTVSMEERGQGGVSGGNTSPHKDLLPKAINLSPP